MGNGSHPSRKRLCRQSFNSHACNTLPNSDPHSGYKTTQGWWGGAASAACNRGTKKFQVKLDTQVPLVLQYRLWLSLRYQRSGVYVGYVGMSGRRLRYRSDVRGVSGGRGMGELRELTVRRFARMRELWPLEVSRWQRFKRWLLGLW